MGAGTGAGRLGGTGMVGDPSPSVSGRFSGSGIVGTVGCCGAGCSTVGRSGLEGPSGGVESPQEASRTANKAATTAFDAVLE